MPTNALSGCGRCGRAVDAGSQFCANCGNDVSSEQGFASTRRMTPLNTSATAVMQNDLLARLRRATLGEYEVLTELGRGGMASVYLAHDLQLDRKVAIKVMLPSLLEGEGMTERFKLEARTAAGLSHPHIIPIYAVRDTELLLYFVMKFVEGRPLDTIIREVGKIPIPMAQAILSKVGEALGYAHRNGVVHRDIKPANLMIDTEGQPIVTDFGIAKVAEMSGLTMTGATIGTPTYMSPEQATAGAITGASDQYSLGIVAYQMLSGHLPFSGETMVSLLYAHCHEPPPPFLGERPDCPPALHDAVMRMLEKKPENRFASLEEAVECIGRVTLSFDDPVRTQLVDLVNKGGNRRILESVKTPRSPIPTRSKLTNRGTSAGAATVSTPPTQTLALPPSRTPLYLGIGIAAVAIAVVVGVLLPRGGAAPGSLPAGASAPGTPAVSIASLAVAPATGNLQLGQSLQLSASARDAAGQPTSVSIVWTSADPSIASVSPGGLVVAKAPGSVSVRAAAGGMESNTLITVASAATGAPAPAPVGPVVASIRVEGVPASLIVGGTAQLRATPLDGRGAPLNAKSVRWTSADPSRASVSATGVVTALTEGDAVLLVRSDAVDRSVTVQILAARSAPIAVAPPPPAVVAPEVPARTVPEPSARPVAVVEPREAVEALIQSYARALESRQISEVRKVYPGIQPEQETQLSNTLRSLEQLKVTFRIGAFDLRGDEATATVSGQYEFFSRENRRTERLAVNIVATIQNGASGWTIRQIRSAR